MGNTIGTRWLTNAEFSLPEQNLLAAVVHKAIRDVQTGTASLRADALAYIHGRNFEIDCACLNLNPTHVRSLLHEQASPAAEPDSALTDDQVRLIHAQYTREPGITLRDLARRHNTTAATLSRRFASLQLEARGRGNPQMTLVTRRRARARHQTEMEQL